MKKVIVLLTVLSAVFTSCKSDDDTASEPKGYFGNGILISHEGSTVSGSVSFVSNDLSTVENDIYNKVNKTELGVFQQSIGFNGDEAFIVVDNVNTVAVVDRFTFEEKAIITEGLSTPRFIAFSGNKGYVTNWGTSIDTDDFVAVIDLDTNKVVSTIPVALGPERIIAKGNKIYVSHKGAFGINNKVSVINLSNKNSIKEISTFFLPDEMILIGNDLWVSCEGTPVWRPEGETEAAFQVIDTNTDEIKQTIEFNLGVHPSVLDFENGQFYYAVGNEVFNIEANVTELPSTALATTTPINGMSVNDGKIYTVNAGDFASAGSLNVYTIATEKWSAPLSVGVVPSKIYFQ